MNRRECLTVGATSLLASLPLCLLTAGRIRNQEPNEHPFRYCLNTSTISGQKLPLTEVIEIASEAGYDGIELWIRDIETAINDGHSTADLKKRIADAGLSVDGAIGFGQWIVDDDETRSKGLQVAKRDMELVKAIGGSSIAAPPAGATNQTDLNLDSAAERYRDLLEIGADIGVTPQLEVWGFSKSLRRLEEVVYVAVASKHENARILPDVYHLYKGGSDFTGLAMVAGSAIDLFHMNDYPASPPRNEIGDADRVFPGDGVAPLDDIIQTLFNNGFRGTLSLELFNRQYWQQEAQEVAVTGLQKMKAAVNQALS